MYPPVAHGEGKFIARDAAALARLEAAGQLALRHFSLAQKGDEGPGGEGDAPALPYSGNEWAGG